MKRYSIFPLGALYVILVQVEPAVRASGVTVGIYADAAAISLTLLTTFSPTSQVDRGSASAGGSVK